MTMARPRRTASRQPLEIRIGLGSCCQASGSAEVYAALQRCIRLLDREVLVREGACVGICHRVPLLEFIEADGRRTMYGGVTPEVVDLIVRRHVVPRGLLASAGRPLRRAWHMLRHDHAWQQAESFRIDPGAGAAGEFLGPQQRIVTANAGESAPTDIQEYMAHGGYQSLRRAVTQMSRRQVLEEIKASHLRGRGGAGFPTGLKWDLVSEQEDPVKYAICNGDEGDPGAFMDRMLLEGYPHRILEGLAIAAYAVGASRAIFYIRQEYPLAVERVSKAIQAALTAGVIGPQVCGSDFSLEVTIRQGAGAFVCGEETALLASIEGKRGMPRLRPPYPAQEGLYGRPTLVNNVETLGNIGWILKAGAKAYSAIGTDRSKGTKIFSLTGKVARGGLIEVPMGMTIRQIVMGIGGGIKQGKAFKAVQIGGPSGGCIPEALADTPVDYEALIEVGAMMGSGGLVVLDETDCMVDIARYFLQFTQNESCGKCTLCRIGTKRMLEILNRLCNGQGRQGDLEELQRLGEQIKLASLCGLGQTAPNPVLTTLKYFRHEYQAHLAGQCPAGKCEALVTYQVTGDCIGCTKCAKVCPVEAVSSRPYEQHYIDMNVCTRCHMCVPECPVNAIRWG